MYMYISRVCVGGCLSCHIKTLHTEDTINCNYSKQLLQMELHTVLVCLTVLCLIADYCSGECS